MFNNSSNIDASHSTFSEVHRDQYYNARSTIQGNQTINTVIHGNQVIQDSHSNLIEILRKASAPSAAHDSAQRYPASKCIEGTRVELLARISSWVDEPDGKPICWLNGRPGSGKSAVSQTIAEKYADEKRLAASFFFSRRDLERRTTQHVVPTLTTQLLNPLPSIRPAVIAALENDYMIPMKVLREQMEKLLLEPISAATEAPNAPLLIIVDALDECDDENLVSELVTLLALLPLKSPLPLRLLITSRPELWLESRFHQAEISSLTLPLDIHTFSAEADIRSFLRHALDKTYDDHPQVMKAVPRPWPPSDDLERIVSKAAGLFIFALAVVKYVQDRMHNPVDRLRAILEDKGTVSTGSAYADLDSLYRDAISVVPDPDIARLVLGVVYCMAVPMSIPGLHKLLQRPDADARILVPALNSVLLASEDGKQPIQFYHASFRDFLTNPQRSQKFTINPSVYHRFMAQLCFETMLNSLKRDMCGIGDPSKANNEIPDLAERRQVAFDEALLYACRFWSRHLAQLPSDGVANEPLLSGLKKFSTAVLLYWVEALSLFGEVENVVVMLREGIHWLKMLPEIPEDVLTLLDDAERLVVLYMDCISQCALHVYVTALSGAPTNSAIRKTFKDQLLGTLILYPGRHENWAAVRRDINLHTPIHSVVFSPQGTLIATAGEKQGVQVWNTITGGNVASLGDRSSTSLLVRFSPSGAFLAAAFENGTVAIWDPKVGREHLKHEGSHTESITCIEFSGNSALLASGSRDHTIQVWSVERAQHLYRLATHEGPVTSLAFSGDSQRLVSGSEDNLVVVWDTATGRVVRGMMGHRKPVNCVAVSNNGSIIASGSEDKTIKIWDPSSGKCKETLSKGHHTGIRFMNFFDDDKHLVTVCSEAILSWSIGSHNKPNAIWSTEQNLKKALKRAPVWQAKALGWGAPKPILRLILRETFSDATIRSISTYFATRSPSFVFTHAGHLYRGSLPDPMNGVPVAPSGTVTTAAITSDGTWAATGDPLGALRIVDLTGPERTWDEAEADIKATPLHSAQTMVPSPDGTRFVIYGLLQWFLVNADYQVVKKIDVPTGLKGSMADIWFKFSPDGRIFFCAETGVWDDETGAVRSFDSETGALRTRFTGLKKVHGCVASADSAWIACGQQGQVDVFSVAGGGRKSMGGLEDDSPVKALVFSDDAQSLVGGTQKGAVHVWDRASGACTATFDASASTGVVTALAYAITPNGRARIAIGREDGSLCVWYPSTPTSASRWHDIVRTDQALVKDISFIQFSDDRSRLTSKGEDGTVFTWAISIEVDDTDTTGCSLCHNSPEEGAGIDSPSNSDKPPVSQDLPHLLSRSDPEEAIDGLFHTAYRVRKDGWLVDGERRVLWMSSLARPRAKDQFCAFQSGLVVFFTPEASALVFLRWIDGA